MVACLKEPQSDGGVCMQFLPFFPCYYRKVVGN
jgi:hypothetical protein